MNDMNSSVTAILNLPVRGRAAFALGIAEMVVNKLTEDKEGSLLAREALNLCWQWVNGEDVNAEQVAEFVDSPGDKDLGVRELLYTDSTVIAAHITVVLAIGYVARQIYEDQQIKVMGSVLWEIGNHSIVDMIENAKTSGCFNQANVDRLTAFLVSNFNGQEPTAAGDPLSVSDVLKRIEL